MHPISWNSTLEYLGWGLIYRLSSYPLLFINAAKASRPSHLCECKIKKTCPWLMLPIRDGHWMSGITPSGSSVSGSTNLWWSLHVWIIFWLVFLLLGLSPNFSSGPGFFRKVGGKALLPLFCHTDPRWFCSVFWLQTSGLFWKRKEKN